MKLSFVLILLLDALNKGCILVINLGSSVAQLSDLTHAPPSEPVDTLYQALIDHHGCLDYVTPSSHSDHCISHLMHLTYNE